MNALDPATSFRDTPFASDQAAPPIPRADQRLAMLARLAELGMKVAEDRAARALAAPRDAEPRHDPAQSFATASRAVRLTLALESRLERDIAAAARAAADDEGDDHDYDDSPPHPRTGLETYPEGHPEAHRARIRDNVWDAIDHQVTELIPAHEILDELHERLIESDRYDAFLYKPLRESVAAICQDLGLAPDWSRWTEEGFPPETRTTGSKWNRLWAYEPEWIASRRRRKAEAEAAALRLAAPPPRPHARN